jgi:hypothetical protein
VPKLAPQPVEDTPAKLAAAAEKRLGIALSPRQAQVARAAEQWRRYRPVSLAMGLSFMALAGWLLWKAHRLHFEQVLAAHTPDAQRRGIALSLRCDLESVEADPRMLDLARRTSTPSADRTRQPS